MPWPTEATLHSLSHIRHQRDAGERPGGNARPYPGFSLSDTCDLARHLRPGASKKKDPVFKPGLLCLRFGETHLMK